MHTLLRPRCLAPLVLAVLCCSCSTKEERADVAFSELSTLVTQIGAELGSINNESSATAAVDTLTGLGDELHDVLTELGELGEDPDLSLEARSRLADKHGGPLRAAVSGAMVQGLRVIGCGFFRSQDLERLCRHQQLRYSSAQVEFAWPLAVLSGRVYHSRAEKKARGEKWRPAGFRPEALYGL